MSCVVYGRVADSTFALTVIFSPDWQPPLQELALARRDLERELRRLVGRAANTGPADLHRVEERARALDGNHAERALVEAGRLVHVPRVALGDDDLPGEVLAGVVGGRAHADPHQLAGGVTGRAPRGKHRGHVGIGRQLLADGRHFPQLALHRVPCLSARERHDLGAGQPVRLGLVEVELRFVEQARELFRRAVLVVPAGFHDHLPRVLARRLADDLRHLRFGQQGPLQPRRHLRADDAARDERGDADHQDHSASHDCSFNAIEARSQKPEGPPDDCQKPEGGSSAEQAFLLASGFLLLASDSRIPCPCLTSA